MSFLVDHNPSRQEPVRFTVEQKPKSCPSDWILNPAMLVQTPVESPGSSPAQWAYIAFSWSEVHVCRVKTSRLRTLVTADVQNGELASPDKRRIRHEASVPCPDKDRCIIVLD